MAKHRPDERLVYLALRTVFMDADAQIRNAKKIRERIQKNQHLSAVQALIREYNIDNVCVVTKTLLEEEVYFSTLKAKIRFPEVFEVSPVQNAERTVSELEAARYEADAIKSVAEGCHDDWMPESREEHAESASKPFTRSRKRSSLQAIGTVPSLYPVYLPLKSQHRLLNEVQGILERACYEFARKELQDLLTEKGWDCAEAVELNIWAHSLIRLEHSFTQQDLDGVGKPFPELMSSMAQLRHTAVHRLRVTASRIEQFMVDSESLTKLLKDKQAVETMTRLRRQTHSTVDELKRRKDLIEARIASTREQFAARKVELERLEQAAVADLLKENLQCVSLAGSHLEEALERAGSGDCALHSSTSVIGSDDGGNPRNGVEETALEDSEEERHKIGATDSD